MKKYPVVRYIIKLVKGKLIDSSGTTELIGYVPAKSRAKAIGKLGLAEHNLFGRINCLSREAGKDWP